MRSSFPLEKPKVEFDFDFVGPLDACWDVWAEEGGACEDSGTDEDVVEF